MGLFAEHVGEYLDAGLAPFPVDTTLKRPAVRGWVTASPSRSRAWANQPRLAEADGLGVNMGAASGVTEIDIDAEGEAWLAVARDRFGASPVLIETASGKYKLWFRYNGEGRHIRPVQGLPIDVLGGGFTIAPPSFRRDNGLSYRFLQGSLSDLPRLPAIRRGALDSRASPLAETIQEGERNIAVWRRAMEEARFCDDLDALIDATETWAEGLPERLSLEEVERCARSAWRYESSGRNYLGRKRPQLNTRDVAMDLLRDAPDAFYLLMLFERFHRGRRFFYIAPRPLGQTLSWRYTRVGAARDVLLARGFIEEVAPPQRGKAAGGYRIREMPISEHNHFTPLPLSTPLEVSPQ